MKEKLVSAFLFSIGIGAHVEPFVISEIFGNAPRRASDAGKEWIELANLSGLDIAIEQMSIVSYKADGRSVLFASEISLPRPIVFQDFVVLAQNKNLGLPYCLKKDIKVIVLSDITILNQGGQEICVTINNQYESCSIISKKTAFSDGVSLYRHLFDSYKQPMWRHEPCELVDGTFATPGKMPVSCSGISDYKAQILEECEKKNNKIYDLAMAKIDAQREHGAIRDIKIDGDPHMAIHCYAPRTSKKICNMASVKAIFSKRDIDAAFEATGDKKGSQQFILLRNMLGEEKTIALEKNVPSKTSDQGSWLPRVVASSVGARVVSLTIDLSPSEVPLNISLMDQGNIIGQRALLTHGVRNIDFSIAQSPIRPALAFSGAAGIIEILIGGAHDEE